MEESKNSQDILLKPQDPPHQALTEAEPEYNVQKQEKPPEKRGKPPVAEDIELQMEYLNIHFLRVGTGLTIAEAAKVKGVSIGKVKKASAWAKYNFLSINPTDYFRDAQVLLNGRIKEMTMRIAECEKGDVVFNKKGKPCMVDGKLILKVDTEHLRALWTRRESYEKTLLRTWGLLQRAYSIQAKNVFTGDVAITQKSVPIIDVMTPEDRDKFEEILDKYQEPSYSN